MVTALQKKAWRELRAMVPQVLTIASVVSCGVAAYLALAGAYDALTQASDGWAARHRLAHAWVTLERAPNALGARLLEVAGVSTLQTRLVVAASVPMPDLPQPAVATVVSIPTRGDPAVNAVEIMSGRRPNPGALDEVLVMVPFMEAHHLTVGDTLTVLLEGVAHRLRIVGTALSSEFIFPVAMGQLLADSKRAVVLWMTYEALAPKTNMEGAFNNLAVRLQPGASLPAVLAQLDDALRGYGARPAFGRDKHASSRILEQEAGQLRILAVWIPTLFLSVAAFVIYVVLSRLIQLQRNIIATLKAVGYSNRQVAVHYVQTALLVVALGTLPGLGVGLWAGRWMVGLYKDFFYFPSLEFVLEPSMVASGVGISLLAALCGALLSVRGATRLSPAEAMQPAPPTLYHRGLLDLLGLSGVFSAAGRMTVRQLERKPLRTLLSAVGIAFAVSLMVTARFALDSVDALMDLQFARAQRDEVTVTFRAPQPYRAVRSTLALPGVLLAEGNRAVAVRFRAHGRSKETVIMAHQDRGVLRQVVDVNGAVVQVPPHGALVSRKLAEILQVRVGDQVEVELLEASDRTVEVEVAALVDEVMGLTAHMGMDALHQLLRQDRQVTSAALLVDTAGLAALYNALSRLPTVAAVGRRTDTLDAFRGQMEATQVGTSILLTLFALIMAVAIIYNNARVALSQRAHELATLRVLGFTRKEIASILTGELAFQLLLGIPVGVWLGRVFATAMSQTVDPEMYRLPVVIAPSTMALATLTALAAGLLSATAVRSRLDHLDLIAVLKTRE